MKIPKKPEERQTIQWSTKRQRRRETDNTMVNKETKTRRDRQYNGHQRDKDEERDRQYNGHQRDKDEERQTMQW